MGAGAAQGLPAGVVNGGVLVTGGSSAAARGLTARCGLASLATQPTMLQVLPVSACLTFALERAQPSPLLPHPCPRLPPLPSTAQCWATWAWPSSSWPSLTTRRCGGSWAGGGRGRGGPGGGAGSSSSSNSRAAVVALQSSHCRGAPLTRSCHLSLPTRRCLTQGSRLGAYTELGVGARAAAADARRAGLAAVRHSRLARAANAQAMEALEPLHDELAMSPVRAVWSGRPCWPALLAASVRLPSACNAAGAARQPGRPGWRGRGARAGCRPLHAGGGRGAAGARGRAADGAEPGGGPGQAAPRGRGARGVGGAQVGWRPTAATDKAWWGNCEQRRGVGGVPLASAAGSLM